MKLGIMQPYFFPYIGYWQLMNAVDTYVIYDDVSFIKNGWINRNRILINGEAKYFNLPTTGAGSFVQIKDVKLNPDPVLIGKLLKKLEVSYRKAPLYGEVMPLLERILTYETLSMVNLLEFQLREIAAYLGITTQLLISSRDVKKDNSLSGQDKVIDICRSLKATEYYNAIGGQELYDSEAFSRNGISLYFLKTSSIIYPQYKNEFVCDLSIIDVMMFNPVEDIRKMLLAYRLL